VILTRHSWLPVCTVCTKQDGVLGYLPVGNALSDSIPQKSFVQKDMPQIKQKIAKIHHKKLVPLYMLLVLCVIYMLYRIMDGVNSLCSFIGSAYTLPLDIPPTAPPTYHAYHAAFSLYLPGSWNLHSISNRHSNFKLHSISNRPSISNEHSISNRHQFSERHSISNRSPISNRHSISKRHSFSDGHSISSRPPIFVGYAFDFGMTIDSI